MYYLFGNLVVSYLCVFIEIFVLKYFSKHSKNINMYFCASTIKKQQ